MDEATPSDIRALAAAAGQLSRDQRPAEHKLGDTAADLVRSSRSDPRLCQAKLDAATSSLSRLGHTVPEPGGYPAEIPTPRRRTAMMGDTGGDPLKRDEYAARFDAEAARLPIADRQPLLGDGEAGAVGALLDEVSAVYRGASLGQLARELGVRLYDRLGI